jgi:hypothetical protein
VAIKLSGNEAASYLESDHRLRMYGAILLLPLTSSRHDAYLSTGRYSLLLYLRSTNHPPNVAAEGASYLEGPGFKSRLGDQLS